MHYTVLMAIEMPQKKDIIPPPHVLEPTDFQMDKFISENTIDETLMQWLNAYVKNFSGKSDFEIYVEKLADDMLAPYCVNTEDPQYLIFQDETNDGLEKYENGRLDFVKMTDGRILERDDYEFSRRYEVFNGQVYRSRFGKLHHRKKTQKAKKIQVMPNRTFKEIYPTFEEFMKRWWQADYDEETGRYGYYINPNGMMDWYEIGGRWPFRFLTKYDLYLTAHGESSSLSADVSEKGALDKFQWVAGARKGDIAWDAMLEFYRKEQKEQFQRYGKWMQTGIVPKDYRLDYRILNDTIVSWNDIVYREGETEESYLLRIGLGPECQYPINTAAILDAEGMKSIFDTDMEGYEKDEKVRQAWARRVSDFIAKQPEDMLLLSIDCHM